MNIASTGVQKMTTITEKLLQDVDFIYEKLVCAVQADKISGQAANSIYNVCAAAKPVINKHIADLRVNGYTSRLRREVTNIYIPIEKTKKYLLTALQPDATNS